MNMRQKSRFTTLVQVLLFTSRNKLALGAVIWSRALAALREVESEVTVYITAQWVAQALALRLTQVKATIRDDLRDRHMRPIAVIAEAMLPDNPMMARLKVPPKRLGDAKLLAAASAMAAAASRRRNLFLREQLPTDFIPRLRHAATAIQRVLLERSQSRTGRVTATQGLEDALKRASRILPILDVQVVEQLAGQPALLAEWKIAKRAVPVAVTRKATPEKATSAKPWRDAA